MDRRSFLKYLGIGLVAPKIIFDMGANLHKQPEYFGRYRVLDEDELIATSGWVDDGTLFKRQALIWPKGYEGVWTGTIKVNPTLNGVITF